MKNEPEKPATIQLLLTGISQDLKSVEKSHFEAHISREEAVLYAMGKLASPEIAQIDQHLSVCDDCCKTQIDLEEGLEAVEDLDRTARLEATGQRGIEILNDSQSSVSQIADPSSSPPGIINHSPSISEIGNPGRVNLATDFLLFSSGASRSILRECPASETSKYAMIGATVFFTGLFAALSSGYAVYRVFFQESYAPALSVGLAALWGSFIFTLDRYIVSTIRSEGSVWRSLASATPRLGLAMMIAIVIATPLKVRIFEDRIAREIDLMKQEEFTVNRNFFRDNLGLPQLDKTIQAKTRDIAATKSLFGIEPSDKIFHYLKDERDQCITLKEDMRANLREREPLLAGRINTTEDQIREKKVSLREAEAKLAKATEELASFHAATGHMEPSETGRGFRPNKEQDTTLRVREQEEIARNAREIIVGLVGKRDRLLQQLSTLRMQFRKKSEECAVLTSNVQEDRKRHV